MNKERELCRLLLTGDLNNADIARLLKTSDKTVRRRRVALAEKHMTWEEVQALDDAQLERLIHPKGGGVNKPFYEPDWKELEKELHKKGVTKALLYEEYRSILPPPGKVVMSGRHFERRLASVRKQLGISMRQVHRAGEKMFVDYSGMRARYFNSEGKSVWCEVFVAALGASGCGYAEASHSQKLQDWLMSHVRAFQYFGGAPQILVPDCLKSAVKCWKGPNAEINDSYRELALSYGAIVEPARPGRPKDKAKVEGCVRLVQMWILAAIRNRIFYSLAELNAEIWRLLEIFNNRPFRRRPDTTRRSLYLAIDRPYLQPLPEYEYEYGEWSHMTVPPDYMVTCDSRDYSVPYSLAHKKVSIKLLADCVKIYHLGREVATHPRNRENFDDTIVDFHRHPKHRFPTLGKVQYSMKWAEQVGGDVLTVMRAIHDDSPTQLVREQRLDGVKKLERKYTLDKLRAACSRALQLGQVSYRSLQSMLANGMQSAPIYGGDGPVAPPTKHRNVRGPSYFTQERRAK